jgi:hypothetical protein
MPAPLQESVVEALRVPTSALAALLVIAAMHRELFAWAAQMIRLEPSPSPQSSGEVRKVRANGVGRKPQGRKPSKRDDGDKALVEAMQLDPTATINDLAHAIGKSSTSTVTALHRLRDAGLVENTGRKWGLVEQPSPPREKWVAPLSATTRARPHSEPAHV